MPVETNGQQCLFIESNAKKLRIPTFVEGMYDLRDLCTTIHGVHHSLHKLTWNFAFVCSLFWNRLFQV